MRGSASAAQIPLTLTLPETGRGNSRIQRDYQPVQPTYAQTTVTPGTRARSPRSTTWAPAPTAPSLSAIADAVSRIRKPTLDEMGSHSNRPIPARAPDVDPRTKAGAYGEQVKGPHKPTLDEMGPHAERGLPVSGKPRAAQADRSRPSTSSTTPKRKSTATAAPAKPAGRGSSGGPAARAGGHAPLKR